MNKENKCYHDYLELEKQTFSQHVRLSLEHTNMLRINKYVENEQISEEMSVVN